MIGRSCDALKPQTGRDIFCFSFGCSKDDDATWTRPHLGNYFFNFVFISLSIGDLKCNPANLFSCEGLLHSDDTDRFL